MTSSDHPSNDRRPGFGASTPVPLEQRVDVYIESVPAVLKKLDVSHVALMSHSAGSIYLHNILLRLPDILHSEHSYVAVLGVTNGSNTYGQILMTDSTLGPSKTFNRSFIYAC